MVYMLHPSFKKNLHLRELCDLSHLHRDAQHGLTPDTTQPQMKCNSQCIHLVVCKAMPEYDSQLCCSHALHFVQSLVPLFELCSEEAHILGNALPSPTLQNCIVPLREMCSNEYHSLCHALPSHTLHSAQCNVVPLSEELNQATAQELLE